MGLLARFVQGVREGPRLIDYELLVGKDGKRCVGFGWFAGGSFRFFSLFPLPYFISPSLPTGL